MNGSSCQFPQPLVDRSRFDGQYRKRKKHGNGVMSKRGFYRPDKRTIKKVKFL